MANPLRIAEPPKRRKPKTQDEQELRKTTERSKVQKPIVAPSLAPSNDKLRQVRETETVQFNRRVTRGVSDGYEMLAIKTRMKVPELLEKGLELLEEKYGKV